MEHVVYLNGALLPREQARVSPFDLGFLYGYGIFETMRAYSGRIFRLREHLDRLARSAAMLGIPVETDALERACYDVLRANDLANARVRLAVSMGEGQGTPDPPADPRPTVLISAASYTPPSGDAYRQGFGAIVSSIRRNSQSPLARVKSANYLDHLLARSEAKAAGADEALLLNESGLLCEGSTTNVFVVAQGSLMTPGDGSGCLPGITRSAVMELAPGLGIPAAEQDITLEGLMHAEEAFVTNSVLELMPLREVDGQPIGVRGEEGVASVVTERLVAAYRELVARETTGTS
jgi:branched-chain amino acid aminotransferase group I